MRNVQFSPVPFAWCCMICAALGMCSAALAQNPIKGEHIMPVNPAASVEVRALAPVLVNPNGSHSFISASSNVSAGGPARFVYLDSNGVYSNVPFGAASWIPSGTGGWYDVRSIDQQVTTGNFVAAGRAFGGSVSGIGANVLLLTSRLGYVANIEPGGADPADTSMKAVALPTGEIVQMVNTTTSAGTPSAWLICYNANLTQVLWWYAYSTTACDQLHFNDMREFAGNLYLVGKMGPYQGALQRPFLMVVGADNSIPTDFGRPLNMWSYAVGSNPAFTSRFTAVNVDAGPGGNPVVWIGGQNVSSSGGFALSWVRVMSINGGTGAKNLDYQYSMWLTPAPGAIVHVGMGSCGNANYLDRVYLAGFDPGNTPTARHIRLDPALPASAWGRDFSPGQPPFSAFNAMLPSSNPSAMLMGGRYRVSNAPGTFHDPYLVMTDCDGRTCQSTDWTQPGQPISAPPVTESPIRRNPHQACDGTPGGFALIISRNIQEYFDVGSGSVTLCMGCIQDLDGDQEVGGADLGILLGSWGACAEGPCNSDLNGDGMVNGADLGALLGSWGSSCP